MPTYTINSTANPVKIEGLQKIELIQDKSYPTLGILDSGIALNKYNEDWIIKRDTPYLEEDLDLAHGTFVSGIVLYGDELSGENHTGVNGCKIVDVPVITSNTDEDELISNIRNGIKRNPGVKIWNLSVSVLKEIEEDKFSDIAIAIDQIQDEFDVIICKSAGNSDAFINNSPKPKLHAPGDSVRAVVVGSISQTTDSFDFSKRDYPSPYTRIGKGPASIIKPDLVHYGGDIFKRSETDLEVIGTNSIGVNGEILSDCGTSFATPRVATILAGLDHELSEEFDPLLLKALLIHSADYGLVTSLDPETKLKQLGFGKPKNVSDILYSSSNEMTLVLRDTLQKSRYVDILDFPFPKNLIDENGLFYGQVSVTLVYNPILRAEQGSEYCQSNINVYFGTYEDKLDRDMSLRHILNPIGRDTSSQNILAKGIYSRKIDWSNGSNFSKERMLISFGDKYYPIKKYSVDLSELTPGNKDKFLKSDRKWFVKLEGLYRHYIEKEAAENDMDLNMDFCLVITIKDPTNNTDVYSGVVNELDNHQFVHRDVRVRNQINLDNDLNN